MTHLIDLTGLIAATPESSALWTFLGRLHPLVVHFPIALVLVGALVELVRIIFRREGGSPFAFTALCYAAVAACLASWFGWIAAEAGVGEDLRTDLFLHRWGGILLSILLLATMCAALLARCTKVHWALPGYRVGLFASAGLVSIVGYFGGELAWGEGYLFRGLIDSGPSEQTTPDIVESSTGTQAVAFTQVQPILEEFCYRCHGPKKQKAKLRLDDMAALFSGPESDWIIKPGDAAGSLLFERMVLPEGEDGKMPPDAPYPSQSQVDLVRNWIDEGAPHDDATPATVSVPRGESTGESAATVDSDGPGQSVDPAVQSAVARLRARGIHVSPLAIDSNEWEVNASLVKPPFANDDMALLDGLQPALVWLNLARSDIDDAGMPALASFINLRKLRLENTKVADAGLESLSQMQKLEVLNLYGTGITDKALSILGGLGSLRTLYVWQTDVTAGAVASFTKQPPSITVIDGRDSAPAAEEGDADSKEQAGDTQPES